MYVDGKKNGKQTNWYDNGQKEVEGNYENDEPAPPAAWAASWVLSGSAGKLGQGLEFGRRASGSKISF